MVIVGHERQSFLWVRADRSRRLKVHAEVQTETRRDCRRPSSSKAMTERGANHRAFLGSNLDKPVIWKTPSALGLWPTMLRLSLEPPRLQPSVPPDLDVDSEHTLGKRPRLYDVAEDGTLIYE